jgi:hypothetical protein
MGTDEQTEKSKSISKTTCQVRCEICGRYFLPDPRVGKRQKACRREACQKTRKRRQEKRWLEGEPGYFRGRSEATREWRAARPGYQKAWRAKKRCEIQTQIPGETPLKSIRLHLRGIDLSGEIQTQIARLTLAGDGLWVDGVDLPGRRDTNADRRLEAASVVCGP